MLKYKLPISALIGFIFNILQPNSALAQRDVVFTSHDKPEFQYNMKYYRTHWNINPNVYGISGSVTTYFTPFANTNFNAIGFDCSLLLKIDSIVYHRKQLTYAVNDSNEILITLLNKVSPKLLDSIEVYYHGQPYNDGETFHQDNHSGVPIITTLSQPYGALLWWPCKQDLIDKADSTDVYITVPTGNLAGSNGILADTVNNDSQTTFHWKERYPIATYLVGIAVTNYAQFTQYSKTSLGDSFPVVNYIYPEYLQSFKSAAPATLQMLHLYDSLYGPYPFRKEKYGHAEWNYGGGMEHQTMSFVSDFSFHLVCHEMAHQWFGDKITCGSWKDIWLNEGFATFNEGISLEYLQGEQSHFTWIQSELATAIDSPHGAIYGSDTIHVSRIFNDQLSYVKGGMVLRTLRHILGDSAFFGGIRAYLQDTALAYRFANTSDIEYHLEKASGKNLNKFFNDWIFSQGYPYYNVYWQQKGKTIKLNIVQTPTDSSVKFFDLPLDLTLQFGNSDSTFFIHPTTNDTTFYISSSKSLKGIDFDPGLWFVSASRVVNDDSLNKTVEIYPNPSTTFITVNFRGTSTSVGGAISLMDMSGKVIFSSPTDGLSNFQINTSNLAPGVYFVNFVSPAEKYTQKLVKMGQGY